MGRHSAPDDEERGLSPFPPPAASRPRPGRHYRPDDADDGGELLHLIAERVTERLPVPDMMLPRPVAAEPEPAAPEETAPIELVPAEPASTELVPAEPPSRKVVAQVGKGNHPASADLELLRRHSALRARVIAAVVVPFVIYTAVMYLIAALPVYFIWVWIPLVTAGVLAGSLLDAEHRRQAKRKQQGSG
jgi:hypothetical protein